MDADLQHPPELIHKMIEFWENGYDVVNTKSLLYIPASIIGSITLDSFVSDGSGTDIYWAGTSGTLTVSPINGTNFTTWASAGGIVDIVAGLVTITFTVAPSITNYEYALYTVTAVGSLDGSVEVQHSEVHGSDSFDYTYSYSAGTVLAVQILDDGTHDFVENITYYTLSENAQNFTIYLDEDTNN